MDDLVLCEAFDFEEKLGSVLYRYLFCPKVQYCGFHIYFCGLFLSFYKLTFFNFWWVKRYYFFSFPFAAACKYQGSYGRVQTVVAHQEMFGTFS